MSCGRHGSSRFCADAHATAHSPVAQLVLVHGPHVSAGQPVDLVVLPADRDTVLGVERQVPGRAVAVTLAAAPQVPGCPFGPVGEHHLAGLDRHLLIQPPVRHPAGVDGRPDADEAVGAHLDVQPVRRPHAVSRPRVPSGAPVNAVEAPGGQADRGPGDEVLLVELFRPIRAAVEVQGPEPAPLAHRQAHLPVRLPAVDLGVRHGQVFVVAALHADRRLAPVDRHPADRQVSPVKVHVRRLALLGPGHGAPARPTAMR